MNENGSTPVSRYELGLALDPMRSDIREMKNDMRAIRESLASNKGEEKASRGFLDSRWRVASIVTLVLTSASATTVYNVVVRRHS